MLFSITSFKLLKISKNVAKNSIWGIGCGSGWPEYFRFKVLDNRCDLVVLWNGSRDIFYVKVVEYFSNMTGVRLLARIRFMYLYLFNAQYVSVVWRGYVLQSRTRHFVQNKEIKLNWPRLETLISIFACCLLLLLGFNFWRMTEGG